jgi:hypothetical protein
MLIFKCRGFNVEYMRKRVDFKRIQQRVLEAWAKQYEEVSKQIGDVEPAPKPKLKSKKRKKRFPHFGAMEDNEPE